MPSSLDEISEEKGLWALLKGASGSGKSVAAMSWPTPYIFDFDKKQPGIARKHFPNKEIHYDTFSDMFQASEKLADFIANGCPYETLITDTITSLTYNIIKSVGQVKGDSTPDLLKKMRGSTNKTLEMLGYDYYNAETRYMKYWLDGLQELWARPGNPKHVIVIAHILTTEYTDMKTKVITKASSIVTAGKAVAAYIPAQFDNEWFFSIRGSGLGEDEEIQHLCCTESIGDIFAKSNINVPPLINFHNKNLYRRIEELKLSSDPAIDLS